MNERYSSDEPMNASVNERAVEKMEAALRPFGWECGPEFWTRYYSDPWVFNLANAVEHLTNADYASLLDVDAFDRDELLDIAQDALLPATGWLAPEMLTLARQDARKVVDALVKAGALSGAERRRAKEMK